MHNAATIRQWNFVAQEQTLTAFAHLLQITPAEALTRYRDGGTGWTVLEILCHLRDFEEVFLQRLERILNEDFPPLPFPNPDELVTSRQYSQQDPAEALAAWRETRGRLHTLLRGVTDAAAWDRAGEHPTRGRFTLNDQFIETSVLETTRL